MNHIAESEDNEAMSDEANLPWLQDDESDVWSLWRVEYRDVVLLDSENRLVQIYNLSENDLSESDKYLELKGYLEFLAP
ncbi:MAG: hypothetical protein QGG40_03230 [Myxococcota bacterium]|nr:hypothetical protein [Myxococcota bacterium]